MSDDPVRIRLEPLAVEMEVSRGAPLMASLAGHGVEFPCGGTGSCGGCGVRVLAGRLPVTDADRTAFSKEQLDGGWRLACQARAETALVLECGQWHVDVLTALQHQRATLCPRLASQPRDPPSSCSL